MLNILVADASEQYCKEIQEFCISYPSVSITDCVYNGKDVLTALNQSKIDVLLMDIILPILDGLSVLHYIAKLPEDQKPAIFVNTAFSDDHMLQELPKLHVMYCFIKPTAPEHIFPRITQMVRNEVQNGTTGSTDDVAIEMSVATNAKNEALNLEITKQIRAVGVPAHLRGYHYLREAIHISVEAKDPSSIAVTKDIYPFIAALYHTRPSLVERSIRNAIEVAWTRGSTKTMHQYFGYTIDDFKGKPTNAEFIAMIADRVRIVMKMG